VQTEAVRAAPRPSPPTRRTRRSPRAERNPRPAQPIGVATAVEALVARAHERRGAGQGGCRREDLLADAGMLAHERPLPVVERARLGEDRVRNRDLAAVVERGGLAEGGLRLQTEAG